MKWWVWVLIGVGGLVVLGIIGSALGDSEDGSTSVPTRAPVAAASPTSPPAAVAATPTAIPTTTAVVAATPQPTPASEPKSSLDAGTYRVGTDIAPGIYAGRAGAGLFGSCYWERLSGVSGTFEEIIANDNANGQFYIEAKPDDKYLKTDCEITPLEDWPAPAQPLTDIGPGTYLVGRDITPAPIAARLGLT